VTEEELLRLRDEQLVTRYQQDHSEEAASMLVKRHYPRLVGLIEQRAWRRHLSRQELQDAKDEAGGILYEAIRCFDAGRGRAQRTSFLSFLRTVADRRVRNVITRLQRLRRHYDRSVPGPEALEKHAARIRIVIGHREESACFASDPAELAEEHERFVRLDWALRRLDASLRAFLNGVLAGASVHHLARRRGISDREAYRQWHELLERLRDELGKEHA
jgi:RNA polymerase sigma factor (sigma-70 family)